MRQATAAIALMAMLVIAANAHASEWVAVSSDEIAEPEITVLESNDSRTVIQYELSGYLTRDLQIEGEDHVALTIPEHGLLMQAGMPDLPTIRRSIIVPDDGQFAYRVLDVTYSEVKTLPVAPSKGHFTRDILPSEVPFEFGDAYEMDTLYPTDNVVLHDPYIMRDFRGMVVEVNPIQYNPVSGTLRVAERIVVEISKQAPGGINVKLRPRTDNRVASDFDLIYRDHFLNYGAGLRYDPIPEPGNLIIITYDAFHGAVMPLVEWKQQKGVPVEIVDVSTIGSTSAQIKTYIDGCYNSAEGVTYIILVGDKAEIPTMTGTAEGADSDPCYAKCEGGDHYPDLFISRISAQNATQVQTQVAKSVNYEKYPDTGAAAAWYAKGTGIASSEGSPPDYTRAGWLRDMLLAYTYTHVDEIYDPGATSSQVTVALNEGRSVLNYIGHGSGTSWGTTGFSNSNVHALTNDGLLPWIIDVACLNGAFSMSECFAEAWLRAGTAAAPRGAVGMYSASTNAAWVPPCDMQYHSIELLTTDQCNTLGGLLFNGVMHAMDVNPGYDGTMLMEQYHIFGDCSMTVRSDVPTDLAMQHMGVLLVGLSTYDVTVTAGGSPVAGALVCGRNAELYAYGYTDANGMVTLDFGAPASVPGILELTATAYNGVPDTDTATIVPPDGPYCIYDSHVCDDDLSGTSSGNGDGLVDAGEQIEIAVTLQNVGNQTAVGISATLSEESAYVTVTDDYEDFGSVPAGGTATCLDDFDITVAGDCPDGHSVLFTLDVTDGVGNWTSTFMVNVLAPVLEAGDITVDDTAGNADGGADPGETILLDVALSNIGHSATANLTGTLSCSHPDAVVIDNLGEGLPVPVGGAGVLVGYEIEILATCPSPAMLPVTVEVTAPDGFSATLAYEIPVGPWFDDGEEDRGWSLGTPGDNASSGTWVREDPVGTEYNGSPCQTEDDHSPDLGTICFVTGNAAPGQAAGTNDVDGGKTTLLTPVFDLSDAISATLSYWRWYTNDLGNNPAEDYWNVDVTADGQSWTSLEHTTASANSWNEFTFDVGAHVAFTEHFQVRFVAEDVIAGSLVEAAVDDLMLDVVRQMSAGLAPADVDAVRAANGIVSCSPNPFNPRQSIVYQVGQLTPVTLKVYDVSGRLVRTLVDATVEAGVYTVVFDGRNATGAAMASGIYFLRLETPEVMQVRQVTLLK